MDAIQTANASRREYRLTTFQKVVYLLYGIGLVLGGGFFLKLAIDPTARDFALVVSALLMGFGLYFILLMLRARLILDGSKIEVRYAIREFKADRSEIEGFRTTERLYGNRKQVCLKDDLGRFDVLNAFAGSDDRSEWFKDLPNLDQRDGAKLLEQISHKDELGANAKQRAPMLNQTRILSIGLSVTAGLASLLALVNYNPIHEIAILLLVILPPIASLLLLLFPLVYTVFKKKADPRTDLTLVLTIPGLGFAMISRASSDTAQLVSFYQPVGWVLLVLFFYLAVPVPIVWTLTGRWASILVLFLVGGIYSIEVLWNINVLDESPSASIYYPTVVKKYKTLGTRPPSFTLRLAPWGPLNNWDDTNVPQSLYEKTRVGDQVCTYLYSGVLGMPWYRVDACPESITSPQITAPARQP